ncbi:hypothetical protein GCM10022402_06480 [Salinactinospora qingdaonensis]|uniref:Uncharacterized protein n=1 Tax=Salinactinospora qingdaonensis TaxID=702744 RepID=A0ABP7EZU3_9ACTN
MHACDAVSFLLDEYRAPYTAVHIMQAEVAEGAVGYGAASVGSDTRAGQGPAPAPAAALWRERLAGESPSTPAARSLPIRQFLPGPPLHFRAAAQVQRGRT